MKNISPLSAANPTDRAAGGGDGISGSRDHEPPRLALNPAEAARALGISSRKLWEITADRDSGIPHVRIGRRVVYPTRELRDWLAQRAEKGAA